MADSPAAAIVDDLGGPGNIDSMTHCATRLRFQLHDDALVDKEKIEAIPGVMGAVPQTGNRYQVVIGGAVESVYNDILALPSMQNHGHATGGEKKELSDAEVKAQARSGGPRGQFAWLDNFFEFLSDSFRPIIGALLGASLFITFMALMSTLHVIGNWADSRTTLPMGWQFVNLMWQCVFYFLPLMVAYNASKKVGADPWVGFAIMGVLLLPGFSAFMTSSGAVKTQILGQTISTVKIFGIPLALRDYGSQVFPPLLMAAVLGPLNKGLKRIIPENLQLIFVPFLCMLIMIPLTAFLIGPIGIVLGAGLASLLQAINNFSPLIFAIVIPLAYPFMVPLGLHWPINAIMLLNIQNLGYDFIQGPMGAWNFACFGATAGVLYHSIRDRDRAMRQTATGALAAGLLGGISEPSLYGIHLRYKRIYPRMLIGCLAGGLVMGLGSMIMHSGGLRTNAFVFTSLLTIPAFRPMGLYAIGVAVAFFTAMFLVILTDYRTPEQKAAARATRETELTEAGATPALAGAPAGGLTTTAAAAGAGATAVATKARVGTSDPLPPEAAANTTNAEAPADDLGRTEAARIPTETPSQAATETETAQPAKATATDDRIAAASPSATTTGATTGTTAAAPAKQPKPAMAPGAITQIGAPLGGVVVPLAEIPDPVFAAGTVGQGVGIDPVDNTVVAPAAGKVIVAQKTGHAFGLALDSGVELLIHVGIDTVNLNGEGFEVHVQRGDRVEAGTPLVTFDRGVIERAGYSLVTPVLVTNAKKFGSVQRAASGTVAAGTPVILVHAKDAQS